ncbi:MAG: 23S rRNA (pseudouridine(1915)-N(3))-methyltransferase RlmH, partial [Terriglobales bacterium]
MKLHIVWIGKTKQSAIRALTEEYLKRLGRYTPTESHELADEDALLKLVEKSSGRTRPTFVVLDEKGRQVTSQDFADLLRDQQQRGSQNLIFAVGPADGFAHKTRHAADLVVSFGKITLAHELARVVLLEQLYRGFTILHG